VSGPGRRRKPNPEEEGSLPAPPRPPAGYGQQQPAQPQHEYEREYDYAYDWRQSQGGQPEAQPGPVFDAFSSGQHQVAPNDQPAYYNPVGYGLNDPYSPTGYGSQPPPTPPQPARQPFSSQPYASPPAPPPSVPRPDAVWPDAPSRNDAPSPQPFPHQAGQPSSRTPFGQPPSYTAPATASPASAPTRPPAPPASDPDALFDDNDLFDSGSFSTSSLSASSATNAAPAAPARAPEPPTVTDPVVPPPPEGGPRPNDGYTAADFAFIEEETGQDVKGWLTFVESRADSRADRTKRFRRRLIGAGAAVAVVAAGIGAYALFNGGSLIGGGGPTKSVVLLQISDSTGNAVADALLVTDHTATTGTGTSKTVTGKGASVLIPSQMVVNSTGFGQQAFGGNMAQSVPAAGKDTVADALGVNIDGVWRMDEVTFAGLIDQIGGIQLNANVAVPAATASPTAAAIPVGNQKLTGGQAVAYSTYTAKGDGPDAQIERFGQVVSGLFAALPTDAGAITAYLNHLGIVDDPALPESKLSPILAALAAEQQAGALTAKALPLRTDGSNELDVQAAAPIVSSLLGGALNTQNNGQISRVLVEDASGHTGIQSQVIRGAAQARLANGGYTFVDGATVAHRSTSVVEVGSDGAKSAAVQLAATLGLQPNDVQVVPGMSSFADATVLLGADWPKLANVTLPGTTN
jgi:anionic cell wall polymer biosynthesis LytR-Cps2A-Psr (LCP) family protein